mmetsp:Transcript_22778/g.47647  ORF Transcript_22778/g.47647 Transcript_22778/m.47647 type:complete len:178 (-) Transcript_22778:298-831(-)
MHLLATMGRARRNQRDAIRKQRVKRRRKNDGERDDDNDEEDHDDIYEYDHIHPIDGRRMNTGNNSVSNKSSHPKHEDSDNGEKVQGVSVKNTCHQPGSSPIDVNGISFTSSGGDEAKGTNLQQYTTKEKPQEHKHSQSEQQKPIRPLDRIERMRLKKQQQKARRREKRAAREASSSK